MEKKDWISVKDRMPDKKAHYLTIRANGLLMIETWYTETSKYLWLSCYLVTHWMPLPEPPEAAIDSTLKPV